jgi:outer membrane protein OmpA-like peptidoglycan-associated protein/flagellar hook assembly protein FlgD
MFYIPDTGFDAKGRALNMRKRWFSISIVFILFAIPCGGLFAQQIPGSQYFYLGNGISYFPLGAAGVADFMRMDSNLYNPAAYGDLKRITTDLTVGGLGSDYTLVNVRGSFPTNIGVITGNAIVLSSPPGVTAGDVVWLKGTFSKAVSEEWLFGTALNLGFAGGGPESDFLASLDIGTIYQKEIAGSGFGFFDYSLGLALKNLGKNINYSGFDAFPPLAVDLGGQLEFLRAGFYRAKAYGHTMFALNPFNDFYGVGLDNVFFDVLTLKVGANFGIEDLNPLALGADLNFTIKDTDFQIAYSVLQAEWSGGKEWVHNVGVSVAFGTYDKKPPKAVVEVADVYYSPNHDGVKDRARLDMDIKDNTMVFGWDLVIADESGRPVRTYEAEDVRKIRKMTLGKYFNRVFSKKQEVEIPEFIEWDGEDAEGNVVPDGEYSYTLTVWDENNNTTVTEKGRLVVDTVFPMVSMEPAYPDLLFSPNNDGAKDVLNLNIRNANIEPDDEVVITITDKNENLVYQEKHRGKVPEQFVWDGTNQSGGVVEEGLYTITITAFDRAGNRTTSSVDGIIVKTRYERVSVSPVLRAFSPNGDGYLDINELKLFSSSNEGLLYWKLLVFDEDDRLVRQYGGEKSIPESVSFDGKNLDGKPLPDGLYSIRFALEYDSGNHPESFFKFIRIDNTPPEISVSASENAFSPNGDGIKDTVSFAHEIESDEGDVFGAELDNAAGASFRTYNYGTRAPGTVVWDGLGDGAVQPVEGTYTYTVVGRDEVGNSTTTQAGPVTLRTGFEEVTIEPDHFVFSPGTGVGRDTVSFDIGTSSREGIVEWRFEIRAADDSSVREFNHETLGPDLPARITWDGRDRENKPVQDGVYTTTLWVLYDAGNNPVSKPKDVEIDTQSPEIELVIEELNLSPNNDGAKETLTIYQDVRGRERDVYVGEVVDARLDVVKRFEWTGTPPVEISWDGRDDEGNLLAEGLYSYRLRGKDVAGNAGESKVSGIILTTGYEEVSMTSSEPGISPNADGSFDQTVFTPDVSSTEGILDWQLRIINTQGKRVRVIEGEGAPPESIPWDGTDDAGEVVPDGEYTYTIALRYESGNHPRSAYRTLVVDGTPPDVLFVVSPKLFSPDGDGEADTMYINVGVRDRSGVAEWDVTHYRVWNDKIDYTRPIKRWEGTGPVKETIQWDGYSDPAPMPSGFVPPDPYTYRRSNGNWEILIDSAARRTAELNAVDIYGNAVNVSRDYDTDILVIRTPEGLKIMINSIQFEFDRADLLSESFQILDRLITKLEKFPNYRVRIVGHTDSVGSEEYNQGLSERRADSVYKYLVDNDVAKERLTTEGKGETQPIDDNEIEAGRARNRRVEFYLTK